MAADVLVGSTTISDSQSTFNDDELHYVLSRLGRSEIKKPTGTDAENLFVKRATQALILATVCSQVNQQKSEKIEE